MLDSGAALPLAPPVAPGCPMEGLDAANDRKAMKTSKFNKVRHVRPEVCLGSGDGGLQEHQSSAAVAEGAACAPEQACPPAAAPGPGGMERHLDDLPVAASSAQGTDAVENRRPADPPAICERVTFHFNGSGEPRAPLPGDLPVPSGLSCGAANQLTLVEAPVDAANTSPLVVSGAANTPAAARPASRPRQAQPATSASPSKWDAACEDIRGVVEVKLAGKRLDDREVTDWCAWARVELPRRGVAHVFDQAQRGPGREHRLRPLILNFSDNRITDDGVKELVKLLVDDLQGVFLRMLFLHKNHLGPASAEDLARLIKGSPENPKCALEELHLSNNWLGQDGILRLLESAAAAGEGGHRPVYPIQVRDRLQPLWLRLECNVEAGDGKEALLARANQCVEAVRRRCGWRSSVPLLCRGRAAGCSTHRCLQQRGSDAPFVHFCCTREDAVAPEADRAAGASAQHAAGANGSGEVASSSKRWQASSEWSGWSEWRERGEGGSRKWKPDSSDATLATEVQQFIRESGFDACAEGALLSSSPEAQRAVLGRGTVSSARNASSMLMARLGAFYAHRHGPSERRADYHSGASGGAGSSAETRPSEVVGKTSQGQKDGDKCGSGGTGAAGASSSSSSWLDRRSPESAAGAEDGDKCDSGGTATAGASSSSSWVDWRSPEAIAGPWGLRREASRDSRGHQGGIAKWDMRTEAPGSRPHICFHHDLAKGQTCRRGGDCAFAHMDTTREADAVRFERAWESHVRWRSRDQSSVRPRSSNPDDSRRDAEKQHCASRATSSGPVGSRVGSQALRAAFKDEDVEAIQRVVDEAIASKVKSLNLGRDTSAAAGIVIVSCWSVGQCYAKKDAGHTDRRYPAWDGVREVCKYYRERQVRVLAVLNPKVARDRRVPEDLAEEVVLPPGSCVHGVPEADNFCTELFLYRLTMALGCQYVCNGRPHPASTVVTSQPDVKDWVISEQGVRLRVEFLFNDEGAFVPLKPPPKRLAA
mmetsp:Transcript_78110/g.253437  ORF Transcript_78110/g.253437 Transcript_78110/m.253437 type:complete len:993 (-) Transcript_78110:22-3000(-)